MSSTVWIALCVVIAVTASASRVILEPGILAVPQSGWHIVRIADDDEMLSVTFALKQPRDGLKHLNDVFLQITDPRSPSYGNYLSIDDLTKFVGARPEHVAAVYKLLAGHGVDRSRIVLHRNRDLLTAKLTVAQANALFDVQMHEFQSDDGHKVIRADRLYSLPAEVADAVDIVEGITRFPRLGRKFDHNEASIASTQDAGKDDWPDDCGCWDLGHGAITPAVLRMRYNISDDVVGKSPNNSMGVAEFQGQFYSPHDLEKFQTQCKLRTDPVAKLVGPNISWLSGTEATLDIQYIMAVAQGVPAWFWSQELYNLYNWITAVGDNPNPPLVFSVSYGNDEVQNNVANMERTNIEFQKIGARGITIIFASGDQGVEGRTGAGKEFHPDFPAASPYVTAVGGTEFIGNTIGTEVGTKWSGGGFSNLFPRPQYQETAVKNYLNDPAAQLPPQSYWNQTGRGYPDISALCGQGHHYCLVHRDLHSYVMGTSASAPVVAAIISLLNDIRLQKGEPVLGFMNPWLYQTAAEHPEAFFDVTSGNNADGGKYGFTAIKGWDPVTGVGTPNYAVLAQLV